LADAGTSPILAVRELTHVDALLGDEPFRVFQAPIFAGSVSGLPAAIGYAETLMRLGFLHPSTLTALCRAWRNLVEALAPQLMLFDYAPTGLLATRGLPIPRALFGSSFSVPPRTEPMPVYRWWKGEPLDRVLASERVVLSGANRALARLGEPPMARLADSSTSTNRSSRQRKSSTSTPDAPERAIGARWPTSRKGSHRSGRSSAPSASSRTSSRISSISKSCSRRCALWTPPS
jgi:hypothetical protein